MRPVKSGLEILAGSVPASTRRVYIPCYLSSDDDWCDLI